MKKNNSGFSLVELIIVIAIMAVLIGVLAPQFIKYVESSRQSTDMQNVQELKTAIETYVADNGENLAADITITIGSQKAKVAGGGLDSTKLAEVGLTEETALKSTGWPSKTFTYSVSKYTWTSDACVNSKEPKKDMKGVFETAASSS